MGPRPVPDQPPLGRILAIQLLLTGVAFCLLAYLVIFGVPLIVLGIAVFAASRDA